MSLELLTLIALWCGSPIEGHSYKTDTSYIGPVVSVQDVNQCRARILKCTENPPEVEQLNETVNRCFTKMPYPGRDQQ